MPFTSDVPNLTCERWYGFLLSATFRSFGYVVEGADFLQAVKEGDVIVSAKVTDGLQYLKQPTA